MKRILTTTFITILIIAALSGCSNKAAEPPSTGTGTLTATPSNTAEPTATQTPTDTPTAEPTATEAPHVHDYTRSVSVEATCTEDGEAVFACECGDSYTESIPALGHTPVDAANAVEATCTEDGKTSDTVCGVCGEVIAEGNMIPATGHNWGTYKSNNDATYTKDGTETATCANCNKTDTRTVAGSKKEYTFTDISATMWVTNSVKICNIPSWDGDRVGNLSEGQEVTVTGICNETGWYRINYSGKTAYIDNYFLKSTKPQPKPQYKPNTPCPYPLNTIFYDDRGYQYFYGYKGGEANLPAEKWEPQDELIHEIMSAMRDKGFSYFGVDYLELGTYAEGDIVVRYVILDGTPYSERYPGLFGIPMDN